MLTESTRYSIMQKTYKRHVLIRMSVFGRLDNRGASSETGTKSLISDSPPN